MESDQRVSVLDSTGTTIVSTDLSSFDRVVAIRAVPFCKHPNGDRHLAVLVGFRLTARRALLIVYGADGKVAYENLMMRSGPLSMYVAVHDGVETLGVIHGTVDTWRCSAS